MSGALAVTALVLLEWAVGWVAGAAWSQSWGVIRRGHFRISAWCAAVLGMLAAAALLAEAAGPGPTAAAAVAAGGPLAYLAAQYVRSDLPGVVAGGVAALAGAAALAVLGGNLAGPAGAAGLVAGAGLLGGVTNGMMLGHWYLNQPGLKAWALGRLTAATLVATAAGAVLAAASAPGLAGSPQMAAALGPAGLGPGAAPLLAAVWVGLVAFTGVVVWMAKRCVDIRSIQSATGLYYVAILTAGVAEFLGRYLTVGA